jgi:hypothetical protein
VLVFAPLTAESTETGKGETAGKKCRQLAELCERIVCRKLSTAGAISLKMFEFQATL